LRHFDLLVLEPGSTRARHEPAIGAAYRTRLVGLRRILAKDHAASLDLGRGAPDLRRSAKESPDVSGGSGRLLTEQVRERVVAWDRPVGEMLDERDGGECRTLALSGGRIPLSFRVWGIVAIFQFTLPSTAPPAASGDIS
jgi:hypothetical protein